MESALLKDLQEWLANLADDINAAARRTEVQHPAQADPTPRLRRALVKVDSRLDALTTRLLDGTVPQEVYERMRDQLTEEKRQVEDQLTQVRVAYRSKAQPVDPDLLAQWGVLPLQAKQEILGRLVGKIWVTPGRPRAKIKIIARWEDIS